MSDHLADYHALVNNWIATTNSMAEAFIANRRERARQQFELEQAERNRQFIRERDRSQQEFTLQRDALQEERANRRDEAQFARTLERDRIQQDFSLNRIDRELDRSLQIQDRIEDRLARRDEAMDQRAQVREMLRAQMARQQAIVGTFTPDAQIEYDRLSAELIAAMQADPSPERDNYLAVLNEQIGDLLQANIEKGYVMRMTSPDRAAYYELQEQINNPPSSLMPHEIPVYQSKLEEQKKKILQRALLNENTTQMDFDRRVVTTPSGIRGLMLNNGSLQILNDPMEQTIESAVKYAIQSYEGMDVPDEVILQRAEKTIQMTERMKRRLRGEPEPPDQMSSAKKREYETLLKTQQMLESVLNRLESKQKADTK